MSEFSATTATAMIHATALRVAEVAEELSRLDAIAGDGDHGVNMTTAFADADRRIARARPDRAAEVFALVGRSFDERAGGSAGALFGVFFATLGRRLGEATTPDTRDLVDGLELASRRVAEIGRTSPGSKTMLDALQPAADAARAAADADGQLPDVMAAAAAAAEHGAASTAEMHATAGRARYSPDGAVGTRDPGAMTIAFIFAAWADAVTSAAAA